MKTTVEISDPLLLRAKRYARRRGMSLRAVLEEGLRRVMEGEQAATDYALRDLSVGEPDGENPLERMSWQDLRDEIYGGPR